MPAATGVYSRDEYNITKQISSEDVRGGHARLWDLYNRPYPGEEVDNNLPLIKKFVTQLINKEVGKFVFERDPAIFAGALALAQTKTATDVTFKTASCASIHAFANPSNNGVNYSGRGRGGGRRGRGKSGSSRPERREGESGKCWICNSSSHQKSDCPVWSKALTLARKESYAAQSFSKALVCHSMLAVHFWPTSELTNSTQREHSLYKGSRFIWSPCSTMVGPTTVTNTAVRIAHLISVFKLKDSPLLDTDAKLKQSAYMLLKRWACFSFDGN
jgi:hypothetical protein